MRRRKSGWEALAGGVAAVSILSVIAVTHLFPLTSMPLLVLGVLFGVFPILGGVRRLVREATERREKKLLAVEERLDRERRTQETVEKTILKIAQQRRGVVTPALVVLGSDLKLEEAEKALGDMAARGYAEMRVKENGTIDYVFHELS